MPFTSSLPITYYVDDVCIGDNRICTIILLKCHITPSFQISNLIPEILEVIN